MKAQKEFGKKYGCVKDCGYIEPINKNLKVMIFIDTYHYIWGNSMGGYISSSIIDCLKLEGIRDYGSVWKIFYFLRKYSMYRSESRG